MTRRTTGGDDDLFVVLCGAGLVKTISGNVDFTFRSGGSISDGGPIMRTLLLATLPTCVRACYMQRRNKERDGLDQSLRSGKVSFASMSQPPSSLYAGLLSPCTPARVPASFLLPGRCEPVREGVPLQACVMNEWSAAWWMNGCLRCCAMDAC